MRIRQAHLEAFQPEADASFERRVVRYLRDEHGGELVRLPTGIPAVERLLGEASEGSEDEPGRIPAGMISVGRLPGKVLLEMVRNGIARARGHGMSSESGLTSFVVLMFVTAPNFDEHPLIRRVLRDSPLVPDERINELWEQTSEENWEAVEQNYRATAWGLKTEER